MLTPHSGRRGGGRLTSIAGQGSRTESWVAIRPRASVHKLVQAVVIHRWTWAFSSGRNQGQVSPFCPRLCIKPPRKGEGQSLHITLLMCPRHTIGDRIGSELCRHTQETGSCLQSHIHSQMPTYNKPNVASDRPCSCSGTCHTSTLPGYLRPGLRETAYHKLRQSGAFSRGWAPEGPGAKLALCPHSRGMPPSATAGQPSSAHLSPTRGQWHQLGLL